MLCIQIRVVEFYLAFDGGGVMLILSGDFLKLSILGTLFDRIFAMAKLPNNHNLDLR